MGKVKQDKQKRKSNRVYPNRRDPALQPVHKTFDGHKLTVKESVFIDEYVATGNGAQSVLKAGYNTKAPCQYANQLLRRIHVNREIQHRLDQLKENSIADAAEILEYFTKVMRGEEKDQFGLEASLGERTKAAQELAKRKIDIPNKLAGQNEATVTIRLDWGE